MFGAELPSWKQIITNGYHGKNAGNSYWSDENLIWTSQTAVSIRLIIENYASYMEKDSVRVWVPDFFCVETQQLFTTEIIQIDYYPVNEHQEPDWNILKEMTGTNIPDIFIFVHYFGVYHDVNRAKEFCKRYDALLIEDCAHVLYNSGKFGLKGDFTVYSPHKILPVCDGGIISYNIKDDRVQKIVEKIKRQLNENAGTGKCVSWRVKKAVQKIIRVRRPTTFKVETHFATGKECPRSNSKLQISRWSYQTILGYSREDVKRIAYIRRMNLDTMNYIVRKLIPELVPMIPEDTICPYVALYSLKNVAEKQDAVNKLEKAGILVTFWPTLSTAVKELKYKSTALEMSRDILVIPIHQGMSPQYMLNKYLRNIKKGNAIYRIEKIEDDAEYKKICENIETVYDNIPQDCIYGTVKSEIECDDLCRYKISDADGYNIGFIQALIKKKAGIRYAVRVNRGPVMKKGCESADIVFQVMKQFRKIMWPLPFFYAPNIEFSPYNMHLACSYGWKCWNRFGYPSGIIDLEEPEEMLRKKLDSKWRNQLVSAEKKGLTVVNDNTRYKDFLNIYLKEQQEKNYIGIPNDILIRLFELGDSPLEIYYVLDEKDNAIAFDIIYRQRHTAHYLVGWNSNEGRKLYLNNLLLYHAAVSMKEKGIKRFDLGGIEYINTEDIARFKEGMRPEKYQLLGEFINIKVFM